MRSRWPRPLSRGPSPPTRSPITPEPREILELGARDPEPTSFEGYAAQASGIRVFDRRSELGSVTTPTLVLVGAEDVLTPPSQAIEIASRIPGAELVVLPRGSHGMIVEFPAPTLAAIESFLSGCRIT